MIVLTADHGDSLGEEGRWGHAYTIYPEVLQVPLIVHVPAALRQRSTSPPMRRRSPPTSRQRCIGCSDTTFGRRRRSSAGHCSGRAATARPPAALRPGRLELGSVYGWIGEGARDLYIADGVALRDYAYRLDGSPTGDATPVTPAVRTAGQRAIREGIGAIAEVYRFAPPSP